MCWLVVIGCEGALFIRRLIWIVKEIFRILTGFTGWDGDALIAASAFWGKEIAKKAGSNRGFS
jgi:hypothetical protein